MKTIATKSNTTLKHIAQLVGSKKHKVYVSICTEVLLYGDYWSGGSKNDWYMVTIGPGAFNQHHRISGGQNGISGSHEPNKVQLESGSVVVCSGTFMGKSATPHIYLHPLDAAYILGGVRFDADTPHEVISDYLKEQQLV